MTERTERTEINVYELIDSSGDTFYVVATSYASAEAQYIAWIKNEIGCEEEEIDRPSMIRALEGDFIS
jgi:hypothetical protein